MLRYGAIELKRSYQRNMLLAELFLVLGIAALIGLTATLFADDSTQPVDDRTFVIDTVSISPPPSVVRFIPMGIPKPAPPPIADLFIADDDSTVEFDFVMPSRSELAAINALADTPGLEGVIHNSAAQVIDEYLPHPDSFVSFSELPEKVFLPDAKYPEIARKAQIEGRVWVRILVDREGNVRDSYIQEPSGANAGFEESALDAARQSKWRPAMQNNQPVALWISYEVRFRLR